MKVSIKDIIASNHSFEYYNSTENQILKINLPNTLVVKITLANNVLEWFVDIYNSKGELLISNWYDYYDDNEDYLISMMTKDIIELTNEVLKYNTRVIVEKKFLFKVTIFQIFKNEIWIEYFKTTKFKI